MKWLYSFHGRLGRPDGLVYFAFDLRNAASGNGTCTDGMYFKTRRQSRRETGGTWTDPAREMGNDPGVGCARGVMIVWWLHSVFAH